MTLMMRLLFLAAIAVTGCATPLPTYPWESHEKALQVLAERSAAVRTVSAADCVLTLTGPDGRGITLDGALAASGADYFRLQGWKFGHKVFDLTSRPDGVWIWAAEQHGEAAGRMPPDVRSWHLAEVWSLVSGELFRRPPDRVDDAGGSRFAVTLPFGRDGLTAACEIDRDTLTVRRYRVTVPGGAPRELTLERYRVIDERTVWPTRLCAVAEAGELTIRMDAAHLNAELPDGAFEPPARATRQP